MLFATIPTDCREKVEAMTKEEKIQMYRRRNQMHKDAAEGYSLWMTTLYKLSLAKHVRL